MKFIVWPRLVCGTRKHRRGTKIVTILVLLLVMLVCANVNIVLRFNQFVYWAKGIIEQYTYDHDNTLPEFGLSLTSNDTLLGNHFCIRPLLDYREKSAVYYLETDYAYLRPIFDQCGENKDFIDSLTVEYTDTSSKICVNLDLNAKCFGQRIDKKLNESEEAQGLVEVGRSEEFIVKNGKFELDVTRSGSYYVFCAQNNVISNR